METKSHGEIDVSKILSSAQSVQTGPDIYSNHAQLFTTPYDMTIDFFIIQQLIGNPKEHKATHLQRLIIPLSMAKGMIGALQELVDRYEKNMGMILPNRNLEIEQKEE